jgi:hypothetical protein
LLPEACGAQVVRPNLAAGFEGFVTQVHKAIDATGRPGVFVFDCLSELASLWSADQMLAISAHAPVARTGLLPISA